LVKTFGGGISIGLRILITNLKVCMKEKFLISLLNKCSIEFQYFGIFYNSGLILRMYLLQIVEKLVEVATHTHQAIFEFLGKNGMETYHT